MTLVWRSDYNGTPGKVTLAKEFTTQNYMWQFPQQYGLWSPAEISTALWLDAADTNTITESGGAVSQWNDKSGNNRHFTQATASLRPAYNSTGLNGKPAIQFVSTVLVFSPFAGILNNTATNIFFVGSGTIRSGSSALIPRFYFQQDSIAYVDNAVIRWTSNTAARIGEWTFDGVDQHQVLINGTIIGTATKAVTSGFSNIYQIGRAGTDNSNGFFAEYIFVPGAISTANRQRIEGYLAHKWGLTANLPSDHPYKLVGPTP